MTDYNYEDTPAPAPKKRGSRLDIFDMLSVLVLIVTACLVLYFAAIFLMPNSALNPFSPARLSALPPTPTPTITEIQLLPTWTATPALGTSTPTFQPTITLEPSATPFSLVTPSITPSPTRTPKAPFSATVTYIDSTIIHSDSACNWQGIAGTVVDSNNADVISITVSLTGTYDGRTKNELTVSGVAPAYGKSGFEFVLGTVPIASDNLLYIHQLE